MKTLGQAAYEAAADSGGLDFHGQSPPTYRELMSCERGIWENIGLAVVQEHAKRRGACSGCAALRGM